MSDPAQIQSAPESTTGKSKPQASTYWKRRKELARAKKAASRQVQSQPDPSTNPSSPPPRIDGPLQAFFDQFLPTFIFDPRREAYREFNRMLRWRKEAFPELRLALSENAKEDRKAWLATFRRALIEHFHWRYGTDVESLPAWQGLCETVGVVPVPGELKAAREAVCNAHVNLVDLTTKYTAFTDDEGHNDNTQRIQVFPSEVALSKYTKRTGFIFPRYGVEDGTILWTLLRRIEDPPPVGTRRNEHNQIIGESVPGAAAEPSEKKGSPKKKRGARSKKGSRRTDSSDVPVNSPENGGQP